MEQKDPRKRAAASLLAQGGNQAKAAEAAGVARSSVMRWLTTPEFKALVQEYRDRPDQDRPQTLEDLVPEAHQLLANALRNDGSVSAARAKLALDILKAAAIAERTTPEGRQGSLSARLQELTDQVESD